MGNIKFRLAFSDLADGIGNDGKVPQCKKIEFQKPELCHRVHIKLCDNGISVHRQRHIIGNRAVGNYHPRRMRGRVSRHSLKRYRGIDKVAVTVIRIIQCAEAAVIKRLFQRNPVFSLRKRTHRCIDIGVRHSHYPADIAQNRP